VTEPARPGGEAGEAVLSLFDRAVRGGAHGLIRGYQLTLSGLVGRHCRYLPSCSEYTDEAIQRHGLWAGGWMGVARICRCGPQGGSGIDNIREELPKDARPWTPWRYGLWESVNDPTAGGISPIPDSGDEPVQRQRKE
jgi:putative membrane protein insertion efficiency factor